MDIFSNFQFSGPQLFKKSQFSKIKTSPALTPYYSFRAPGICSTSHSSVVLEARRRQHMRQHGENENFRSQKSSE